LASVAGYTLERVIGRGAHGIVYEAVHEKLTARRVALKVLEPTDDDRRVERFIREMEVLGKIDHPNVVKVHAAGADPDGKLFIAMELVMGPDLARALEGGASIERACRWLVEAARGLAALHEKGIVHRDVKPANILVGVEGHAKICDLGIARDTTRKTQLTGAGDVLGSFDYMSPEQAHGQPVDARTDVFGLGAVLYRILAGRPPYSARTALEALRVATEARPPRPSEVSTAPVPAVLETLCLRAIARDPRRRPQDARAFALALEKALAATRVDETIARWRTVARQARPVLVLAALVLPLAALAWVVWKAFPGADDPAFAMATKQLDLERATQRVLASHGQKAIDDARLDLERLLVETAALASSEVSPKSPRGGNTSGRDAPASFKTARRSALEAARGASLAVADFERARAHAAEVFALGGGEPAIVEAASIELALEEPALAMAWLERGGDRGDEKLVARCAAELALGERSGDLAPVASLVLEHATGTAREALTMLTAEALLRSGDARGALATVAGLDTPGALALGAEAHAALGDADLARESVRRAEGATLRSEPCRLAFYASTPERLVRASAATLEARGDLVAAADAFRRATDLSLGKRAGRLALRRAAALLEAGEDTQQPLALAEREGLVAEARLLRMRACFGGGDLAGALHAADGAGSSRAAVLGRARLALLISEIDPSRNAPGMFSQARRELDALARTEDGEALALLGWADELAGVPTSRRGELAVTRGGGAEAYALSGRQRLAAHDEGGAERDLARARQLARSPLARELALLAVGWRYPPSIRKDAVFEARERLRRAALDSLADAPARALLARLDRLEGHPGRALFWAHSAVRADPLDPDAQAELGLATDDPTEKRRALEAAFHAGTEAEALLALARIALQAGDVNTGIEIIRTALEQRPNDRPLLDMAISAAEGRDEVRQLLAQQRAALDRADEQARAIDAVVDKMSATRAPERDDAVIVEKRTEALALVPTSGRFMARAHSLAGLNRYREALLDHAHAVVLDGSGIIDLLERARAFCAVDPDGARAAIDELALDHESADRALVRAAIAFAIGAGPERDRVADARTRMAAWREAATTASKAIALEPRSAGLRAVRGVLLLAIDHREEGEREIERAERAGVESVGALEYLCARFSALNADKPGALRHLDAAINARLVDDRPRLDLAAGAKSWFGSDPEIRKRLERLVH
jgi:tRNA A-37 threonylcarbamoyl transferase component Bud32